MGLIQSYGVTKDRKIYGNCQVLSPEGVLMFRCDKKKVNWYLNRNLADVVTNSPLVIKLKFQPRGLGNHNKEFGLTRMNNKCVCCGTEEYLTKHHVVPYCYRKFFPLKLKSHNFHDVLPMCASCHAKYERTADKLREFLAEKYNAPINGEKIDNKDLIKFSKIASTLLKEDLNKIPISRVNELKSSIRSKFNIKRLTTKKLEEISKLKINTIERTHAQIVMEQVTDIQSFVEMWRDHFVTNNDCRFLPKNWSIKTKIYNNGL
jgi:hypothetical protein